MKTYDAGKFDIAVIGAGHAGIEAALNGDTSSTLKEYSDAQSAFAASKKHGFYYVNHT